LQTAEWLSEAHLFGFGPSPAIFRQRFQRVRQSAPLGFYTPCPVLFSGVACMVSNAMAIVVRSSATMRRSLRIRMHRPYLLDHKTLYSLRRRYGQILQLYFWRRPVCLYSERVRFARFRDRRLIWCLEFCSAESWSSSRFR
jgi:hypothetical protein